MEASGQVYFLAGLTLGMGLNYAPESLCVNCGEEKVSLLYWNGTPISRSLSC
jgi:hypothetical protein